MLRAKLSSNGHKCDLAFFQWLTDCHLKCLLKDFDRQRPKLYLRKKWIKVTSGIQPHCWLLTHIHTHTLPSGSFPFLKFFLMTYWSQHVHAQLISPLELSTSTAVLENFNPGVKL